MLSSEVGQALPLPESRRATVGCVLNTRSPINQLAPPPRVHAPCGGVATTTGDNKEH